MPEYRAYVVGEDEHFVGFEPMICRDDAEAILKAGRLVDDHDIELWSGERLVVRLSHEKKHGPQKLPLGPKLITNAFGSLSNKAYPSCEPPRFSSERRPRFELRRAKLDRHSRLCARSGRSSRTIPKVHGASI